jgi:hypothetical protein
VLIDIDWNCCRVATIGFNFTVAICCCCVFFVVPITIATASNVKDTTGELEMLAMNCDWDASVGSGAPRSQASRYFVLR